MTDDEKHMALCGHCQQDQTPRLWACVICNTHGMGLGCPNHPHHVDHSGDISPEYPTS